jgi:hypothetical protein
LGNQVLVHAIIDPPDEHSGKCPEDDPYQHGLYDSHVCTLLHLQPRGRRHVSELCRTIGAVEQRQADFTACCWMTRSDWHALFPIRARASISSPSPVTRWMCPPGGTQWEISLPRDKSSVVSWALPLDRRVSSPSRAGTIRLVYGPDTRNYEKIR